MINFIFALYSLFVFQLSYAVDIKHWVMGFFSLTIPMVLVVNAAFMFIYIFSKSWKFVLSLLILVIGYPLLTRTFVWKQQEINVSARPLSVLSYNVMYADYGSLIADKSASDPIHLANAIDTLRADIKCFQEFYNNDKVKEMRLFKRLKKTNPHYSYMHKNVLEKDPNGAIGLATFSKYPIIKTEQLFWAPNNNGILQTDIVVKKDTIRVMNVQLRSMGIRVRKILEADNTRKKEETKNLLIQLKNGFADRAGQVNILEEFILKSPYPVILCGDFNEIPYGYAYGKVRKLLNNSFEDKGRGFGFTYHKVLDFLRIDNIFYDPEYFKITKFETLKKVSESDHYPIRAEYDLGE